MKNMQKLAKINEIIIENESDIWFALMTDDEDNDWGTGKADLNEAVDMLRSALGVYPEAHIDVVVGSQRDPICVEQIYPDDI